MNNKNFKVIKHLGMLSAPAGDTAKTVSICKRQEKSRPVLEKN